MAMTANGYIAQANDDTSWISKEEWNSYSQFCRKAGCLIVGRRTYNILTKQPEFSELKAVKIAVVSNQDIKLIAPNHFIAHSPEEALNLFKAQDEVIIAGGGMMNASFLEKNLIDEIYLDIEPIIFSEGISLFRDRKFLAKLELLEIKNITKDELQLHYKVLK
jgi:dihydrofolate reductase